MQPGKKIEKFPEERRERFLTPEELERLGAAIREGETVGIAWREDGDAPKSKHLAKEENQRTLLSPDAAAALRLLIFTGARLREILHLRWEHVDLGRGLLLLPDSKTGRKTIVLNRPALEILQAHPRNWLICHQSAPILTGRGQISRSPGRPSVGARGSKAFGCTTCGTRLRRLAREQVLASRSSASSSVIRKRRRPPATPIWTRIRCSAQRT